MSWDEIEGAPPRFTIRTIWDRLDQVGDLFTPTLTMAQDLRRATAELQSMV